MRVSSNQKYNPSFNAQLLSQWKCLSQTGKAKNVTILALEERDLGYIKHFRKKLDRYNFTPIRQAIIDASSQMIRDILEKISGKKIKLRCLQPFMTVIYADY